jgi:2-polyprenyl-3-methyl-5-hydroxy-6-metoxy-1,4-benzoquinol methylase
MYFKLRYRVSVSKKFLRKQLIEYSEKYYGFKNTVYKHSLIARYIFKKSDSLLNFWELAHLTSNTRWLTGSSPAAELGFLKFTPSKKSPKSILVVGIGKGHTANHLSKLGFEVQALDITERAFRNLNKRISKRHLATNYSTLRREKFDVILHHLVAQHMGQIELMEQIEVLLKCLSPKGEIRMQIASAINPIEDYSNERIDDQKAGRVLRTLDKLVIDLKLRFKVEISVENVQDFPDWENGWRWYLLVIKNSQINTLIKNS